MPKSKWLDLVLDINFMPLSIFDLNFFFIFLESIIQLRSSSNIFVGYHRFNVILPFLAKI